MSKNASVDLSFSTLLTIVFIVLKLLGKIKWSWIWVLSPMWISLIVSIIIIVIWIRFMK